MNRWSRALEGAGWNVVRAKSLAELAAAVYRGADVAVIDAETPADVRTLAAVQGIIDLPPMLIRASALAYRRPLPGSWRAHLHVGTLDDVTLIAATSLLNSAGRTRTTNLPVRLPVAPVTKWALKLA